MNTPQQSALNTFPKNKKHTSNLLASENLSLSDLSLNDLSQILIPNLLTAAVSCHQVGFYFRP